MTEQKPVTPHNVDNLISEDAALQRGVQLKPIETPATDVLRGTQDAELKTITPEIPNNSEAKTDQQSNSKENLNSSESTESVKNDQNIDEYGNEIGKTAKDAKYSQEEVDQIVNQKVRERLARSKYEYEQSQQQQQQQKPASEESEESWESQLESVIDRRLEQKTREQRENEWRQKEMSKQAEFEAKFHQGMSRYGDFHNVVTKHNITDAMMLATRSLNDPAGFLYTASKNHSAELNKIASMDDPYAQVAEMGKLHERMIKSNSGISRAPHVLSTATSDMGAPPVKKEMSIDERVEAHAKSKRR